MRVSQFEIYRLCQRSLEALGAAYGIDRDGAEAVVWLEARGLPGLALFARELPALEKPGAFAGLAGAAGDARLDAGGRPAIALLGGVIDYLRLLAASAKDRCAHLTLESCLSPLTLLPAALAACERDDAAEIDWPGITVRIGAKRLQIAVQPGLDAAAALSEAGPCAVRLELALAGSPAKRLAVPPVLTQDDLDEAYVRSLGEGIEVDDPLWQRLNAVAARVQVPASEVSRLKGAGGGDANA